MSLLDRTATFAASRAALVAVAAWGAAEAVALPLVPDILLGLLVLAAPRQLPRLFAALVLGALAGTALLYAAAVANSAVVEALLLALPGIDGGMVGDAVDATATGSLAPLLAFGPGTPLKVFTYGWVAGSGGPLLLAAGVVLNRITRILPLTLALALAGWLAPAWLRRHERAVLAGYALFYVGTYAIYWS